MKKIQLRKSLSEHLSRNKWQYFCVTLSLIIGVFAGSLTATMKNAEFESLETYIKNFVSAYSLQSVNNIDVFKFSIYNNIKVIIFMWVSGLWIWLMPMSIVQIFSKGYKLGVSATVFVRVFGIPGIFFSFVSMLPQILLLVPSLIIYAVFNIKFSFALYRTKGQRVSGNAKSEMYFKNFLHLIGIIFISLLCSLTDAFVMPVILKPTCLFLLK
ncbi:MAG: stage II sporulation protein M [Clostridia bacterium]|nr:stage II sporulation protein M [Clostridia bacterium]